jgi:ABC-type sugar transport system ATPase subunit
MGESQRGQPAEGVAGAMARHKPAIPDSDEPTRGIDVGARRDENSQSLRAEGMSILFISSELRKWSAIRAVVVPDC